MMSSNKQFKKDTGYAYIILLSCFALRATEVYITVTFGIYVLEFLEYFHTNRALNVTYLGGLYSLNQALSGPVYGVLMKKYGIRPVVMVSAVISSGFFLVAGSFPSLKVLTVTFIINGICSQPLLLAGQVIVQQYFDKKRSLASGLAMSGGSWGYFIWPSVVRFLIDEYTWRGSYYIYAGIMAHNVVLASLLRPAPQNEITENHRAKVKSKKSRISRTTVSCKVKYINWILYLCGTVLMASGHFATAVYFPIKANHEGIEKHKIPFMIAVVGVMGIILRPLSGLIGDLRCIDRLMLTSVSLALSGVSIILATFIYGFPAMMALAVMFGVMQSFYSGTTGAQVVDVFTLKNIEIGAGLFSMCFGLGLCILNPLAGLLIDLTGTTDSVFYVFGGAHILGGVIFAIVSRLTVHLKKTSPSIVEDLQKTEIGESMSLQ